MNTTSTSVTPISSDIRNSVDSQVSPTLPSTPPQQYQPGSSSPDNQLLEANLQENPQDSPEVEERCEEEDEEDDDDNLTPEERERERIRDLARRDPDSIFISILNLTRELDAHKAAREAGDHDTLTPEEREQQKKAAAVHIQSVFANIVSLSQGIVTHHSATTLQRQLLGVVSGDHADRFQIDNEQVLGVGSFGVVYRGVDLASGQFVAVKVAKVGALVPHVARQLSEEFVKLRGIADIHIVSTLDFSICRKTGTAQLFMEWMAGGSVTTIMSNLGRGSPLPVPTIRRYMKHSLDGLQYLYEHNVVHKDIKPSNMLVNEDGHLKLGDLGSASMLGAVASSRGEKGGSDESAQSTAVPELVGTPAYMAPECVQRGEYSADSDIWSWACSVLEMASGCPPWSHIPADQQKACATMFHVGTASHRDASVRATLSPECIAILEQPPDCSERSHTPIGNYFSEEHHKAANGVVYPLIPNTVPQPLVEILTWCFRVDPSLRPTAQLLLGTLIVRNALA